MNHILYLMSHSASVQLHVLVFLKGFLSGNLIYFPSAHTLLDLVTLNTSKSDG